MLFWLWAIVPVAGFLIYGMKKRKKILLGFAGKDMLCVLAPGRSNVREWAKIILILLAMILAVIALAEPKMGFHWERISQKGVDIMIALDCSRSMLAQDVEPSRLERAKREIMDLVTLMKTDRAGLVAFAGNAFLQCPLTLDYQGFHIFLRSLSPDFLPLGGTNIKAAIDVCYSAFDPASDTDKAIILITDGENTSGNLEKIAEKMKEKNIRIFAVGVGDIHGAPVPAASGGFVKDANGSIVMSKVDEKWLRQICSLTNGYYVRSVAGDMDLEEIYNRRICSDMNQKEFEQGRKKTGTPRFQWFLFPCVLLLLAEAWIMRSDSGKKKPSQIRAMMLVLLMAIWAIPETGAAENLVAKGIQAFENQKFEQAKTCFIKAQLKQPDDLRLYYNIGTAAYKNQEYDLALDNFAKAAETSDHKLQHNSWYNMANTLIKKGNLEQAKKILEQLLESFPNDQQARDNLAWVKKKLEEQKKQQKKNPSQKQNHKQDQQKNKSDSDASNKNSDQKLQNSQAGQDKNQQKQNPAQGNGKKTSQNKETPKPKESAQNAGSNGNSMSGNPMQRHSMQQGKDSPADAKLNRLKDMPGAALIPRTRGQKVEKDW